MFCKKSVLKNLAKFTVKHLCQSFFFNNVAGLRPATILKKRFWHRCFSVNFAKFSGTPFFIEHLWRLLLNEFRVPYFFLNYALWFFSLIISFSFLTFIVVKRDEKILEGKIKFRKRYFGSPIMQLGKCGFCMMALKGHCSLPCLLVKCSQNLIYFLEVLNSFSKFLDNSRKSQTVLGVLNSSLKF